MSLVRYTRNVCIGSSLSGLILSIPTFFGHPFASAKYIAAIMFSLAFGQVYGYWERTKEGRRVEGSA